MSTSSRGAAFALTAIASLLACASDGASAPPDTTAVPAPISTSSPAPAPTVPSSCQGSACGPAPAADKVPSLRVRFLGVDGFLLEAGDEALLTAPLFTRPSMIEASTGLPVRSDAALVAKRLPSSATANVRAIISGHAHYDHLLDVPATMVLAPKATLYSNVSSRNLLAAFAPDRAAKCAGTAAQEKTIARSRIVAVDDPASSTVDYTNCPQQKPADAPLEGKWMTVPGAHLRVLAVCSEHPDQIGPIHYGAGDVTEEACTPPTNMNDWKEGHTLAFLVDFLDPTTNEPLYRIFYEDAPTDTPIGHVPAKFLAEKRVDLALMCVGTYDRVDGASPANALAALTPRYALGGHWEDFFGSADAPPVAIPFLDVPGWANKARAALPSSGEPHAMLHGGIASPDRASIPQPGDTYEINP